MEIITSLDNKRIKRYSKLLQKKYREEESLFLVEGEHLVEEAYKSGKLLCVIKTEDVDVNYDVETIYVSRDVIKKLSSTMSPQNIIGVVKYLDKNNIGEKVIILDGLQDPGNLGTIIRSSVAFNFDTVILSDNCVDVYNDKVIRSSEGMIFNTNIIRGNILEIINDLKNKDYKIYGTSVVNGISSSEVNGNDKLAFIIGNEGNGISDEVFKLCDKNIYVPMNSKCESLNASICASIIMYELNK